jgi:hypothetical protein
LPASIGAEECLAMAVIIGAVVLIGLPQWRKAPAALTQRVGSGQGVPKPSMGKSIALNLPPSLNPLTVLP